jgi:hypothetical protein
VDVFRRAGMVAGAAVGLSRFAVKKLEDEHLARVYHKPRPTRTPFTAESATAILGDLRERAERERERWRQVGPHTRRDQVMPFQLNAIPCDARQC